MFGELLEGMFANSKLLVLDFSRIGNETPKSLDIRQYFEACERRGDNPRLPANRQAFNDLAITANKTRYLVSLHGEDRRAMLRDTHIGREGRTCHLGIDIFSSSLEPLLAPSDGEVVQAGYESGFGNYGHYLVFRPDGCDFWMFFGHLSANSATPGQYKRGDQLGLLGDFADNENGGWSRHLHLQLMTAYRPGQTPPIGYCRQAELTENQELYPDPMRLFPQWRLICEEPPI